VACDRCQGRPSCVKCLWGIFGKGEIPESLNNFMGRPSLPLCVKVAFCEMGLFLPFFPTVYTPPTQPIIYPPPSDAPSTLTTIRNYGQVGSSSLGPDLDKNQILKFVLQWAQSGCEFDVRECSYWQPDGMRPYFLE
jgi:hypothetical protein